MKGVADIFISKEKLAIFWYLASLSCLVFTGWHLHGLAVERRGTMLYVPLENSDYYLDRTLKLETTNELLDYHTRFALETYLNRGPSGPLTATRLPYLFYGKGLDQVLADEKALRFDFANQKTHQMLEVGRVTLELEENLSATTIIQGQLLRISSHPTTGETVVQSFKVQARMGWERNPNALLARRFAWVCNDVAYSLDEVVADPEAEKKEK
ncbi:hypothetical protein [Brevifollis gellanilyticus]|uniref:Uncharacterized protein n=1 Tax=Brevifollis gellanilyticus TaxID=748831 RepID=A0A512M5T9_9BACT|nr:hypothetical protein [Brevifollis gellanilyticus]GEP42099.1 hypothetical protein BGE01nite_13900 [Brevifollis gellanilyticus]